MSQNVNNALAQAAIDAGNMALHPEDRDPPGLFEKEDTLWTHEYRYNLLKCRLFGHSKEEYNLLNHDRKVIGTVEWCPTCRQMFDAQRRILE